jgi:hypothetical protein
VGTPPPATVRIQPYIAGVHLVFDLASQTLPLGLPPPSTHTSFSLSLPRSLLGYANWGLSSIRGTARAHVCTTNRMMVLDEESAGWQGPDGVSVGFDASAENRHDEQLKEKLIQLAARV